MIFYYLPIAQNAVNKTVSDFFQRFKCLFMYVHIFYFFSIYWSDTSLGTTQWATWLIGQRSTFTFGTYILSLSH